MQIGVVLPGFGATLVVTSLMDAQEFPGTTSVYEGVAGVVGTFLGSRTTGTAWNEQAP
jgi:hypothetical protein